MAEKKDKNKVGFFNKLRYKYRLTIYNENTFEQVLSYRLNRLNVLSLFAVLAFFLIAIVSVIIAFTPLKEYIPGYPDGETERSIKANFRKVDSLENKLGEMIQVYNNLQTIISGGEPVNYINTNDSISVPSEISFEKSREDSLLRQKIEEEQRYNLSFFKTDQEGEFYKTQFYAPVNGVITSRYDVSKDHYGTDVVAAHDEIIHATLDGTVILSSWTLETGYIIQLQHNNNFVSIYKHIDRSLVEMGSLVKAGDPIAIIGNSGELSTGPHLHFELWHNGKSLNPEDYVVF